MGLLDWVDPTREKVIGLLSGMPISQAARGNVSVGGLLDALKAMPKFDKNAKIEDQSAFWNPAGMLGKIVWHGSPHKFDKFDASKIGTGEGAQAYGHGVYLADSPGVAKDYAEKLSSAGLARNKLAQSGGDIDAAIAAAETSIQNYKALIAQGGGGDPRRAQGMLTLAEKKLKDLAAMKSGQLDEAGSIYKADLPDEWIPKMLDWDKPVPKETIEALSKQGIDALPANRAWARGMLETWKEYTPREGREVIENLSRYLGKENTAAFLKAGGIPGIRYLDGGSRGAGQGSYNYVVFPGLEDKVKILERNGVPLGLLGAMP